MKSRAGNFRAATTPNSKPRTPSPALYLRPCSAIFQPDKLIPTDGKIKELAMQVTGTQTGTVAKAKAAYDYLFNTMKYDKTGTGWGRGDAVWACDAKHGNCTDFHSPFIGMMRADDIPARFDIGFPIPENKEKRRHCRLSLLGGVLRTQHRLGSCRHLRGVEGERESRLLLRHSRR